MCYAKQSKWVFDTKLFAQNFSPSKYRQKNPIFDTGKNKTGSSVQTIQLVQQFRPVRSYRQTFTALRHCGFHICLLEGALFNY